MSKYEVGDKIVMEITKIFSDNFGTKDCIVKGFTRCDENCLSEHSEPLSTYTEPLEAKIRRQAAEITRLLAENKELKEDFEKSKRVNLNMGRLAGQNEAWELVRKIFDMETNDIEDIFITEDAWNLGTVLNNYTYQEAAAKVAEWEKAKEIKVGDVYMSRVGNYFAIYDIDHEKGIAKILWSDLSNSARELDDIKEYYIKTGRHIDIDSFLKQIGEEQE